MSSIIHYEVYVFQNGVWDLLARYPAEQRVAATEHAKSIEKTEQRPTKVLRETYDLNTQSFQEVLVYLSEIPKHKETPRNIYSNTTIPKLASTKERKSPNRKIAENLTILFLSMLFSAVMAGIITAALLHLVVSANLLPPNTSNRFILGVFTFFFVILSIPISSKWVNWNAFFPEDFTEENKEKRIISAAKKEMTFSKRELYEIGPKKEEKQPSLLSRIMENIFDSFDLLMGRKPFSQRLQKKREKEEKQEKLETAAEETEEKETLEEEKETVLENSEEPEQPEIIGNEEKTEEKNIEKQTDDVVIPPELEEYYLKATTFLSIILRILQNKNIQLNTYTRFGLELFLSGACEHLCQENHLSKLQNQQILSGLLILLGQSPASAEIFFHKQEEYILEAKYLPMIENGAEGMRIYSSNNSSPELISLVQSSMNYWLEPDKKDSPSSGICTIMFTDIVSSTYMTQLLGDSLAQQLIRLHNSIVRKALKNCGGSEVKHTGDGIMASFLWASNAIDAAIAIQRAVVEHNLQSPTVPLEIRIGLNTGEPIVEDNDFFGHTVQLASRICGKAEANQILVSSVVKELSAGKNYTFKPLGSFALKGIDDLQLLYEVIWNKNDPAIRENETKTTTPTQKNTEEIELSKILPEL